MEVKKTKITIPLICTVLSFVGGCISYFYIEHKIPMQWDIHWEVSRWAPKESVFFISAVPFILYIIMSSKAARKAGSNENAGRITTVAITYLMIFFQWITITASLRVPLNFKIILPLAIGIVLIVIGNFMPTLKRNLFIGFRTPWSIRNDISWKKTNRFGGYYMTILGFLILLGGVIQEVMIIRVAAVFAVLGVVCGVIYSYKLRRG